MKDKIRISVTLHHSRPLELNVIRALANPIHRASVARSLLVSGLDKTPSIDDCVSVGVDARSTFRFSVHLFRASETDAKFITAMEAIPKLRRQDWIKARLVAALSHCEIGYLQKVPPVELSVDSSAPLSPSQPIKPSLDIDFDELESQRVNLDFELPESVVVHPAVADVADVIAVAEEDDIGAMLGGLFK